MPEYQGKGFGTKLMEKIVNWMRQKDITCHAWEDMSGSIAVSAGGTFPSGFR
ncbi:TPA: GNAT family N-acetyltransferase [Candidatus Poribacteria bacterium]|nr:GNAT family N-acetyltransferase [Candidatus Poribacteria bacterium]HIN27943.1 GNAT family N-acetyltransferase [Candidatus Poribacteria bacterium]